MELASVLHVHILKAPVATDKSKFASALHAWSRLVRHVLDFHCYTNLHLRKSGISNGSHI